MRTLLEDMLLKRKTLKAYQITSMMAITLDEPTDYELLKEFITSNN